MGVENSIYLKTVHLNTKNAILVSAKDTNSFTADLEGEIIQKMKKRVQIFPNLNGRRIFSKLDLSEGLFTNTSGRKVCRIINY